MDPGGATTGRLLSTGNVVDEIQLETGEKCHVTIVDAGNPTAFVRAEELGLKGTELPGEFEQEVETKAKLEALRRKVAERMGIPVSPSIPKISFIAPSQTYKTVTGEEIGKDEISMMARVMAMGKMHKTFAITAGIPAAIGAVIPGSVVNQVVGGSSEGTGEREIIIGHPSGMMDVKVEARFDGDQPSIVSCTVGRTARKIMEGKVYISKKVYSNKT
jgi:2-methylaconitate cis-trans-isomerase PrpF